MKRWVGRLQCAAACLLVVAYASLAHYSNATGAHDLGAVLALAPLAVVTGLVWRETPPMIAAPLTGALAALVYWLWPLLRQNFSVLYLVQESGLYALLGLSFARSLGGGRVAVCTRLADRVHGPLGPREVRYTRRVTAAWTVFFLAIALLCVLLYVLAPLNVWSLFVNFCVLPLVAVMFVAEYAVRRQVLPEVSRDGLLASMRVYFADSP